MREHPSDVTAPLLAAPGSRRPSYTEPNVEAIETSILPSRSTFPVSAKEESENTAKEVTEAVRFVNPWLPGSQPVYTPVSGTGSDGAAIPVPPASIWDGSAAWLFYYFLTNLGLTLYNKLLMDRFPYPWALTGLHTLFGTLGALLMYQRGAFEWSPLSLQENLVLLAFSSLYTINIAVSNISLALVSVPFHQVVRSTGPLFTAALNVLLLRKYASRESMIALMPIVIGVALATYGDYSCTMWGLFLTLLGTVLASLKGIVTNMILVGRLKLHPLDLLLRMSPLACAQCLIISYLSGEMATLVEHSKTEMHFSNAAGLIFNGVLAFCLNVVSFTANKKTSALSMAVAANVKQALTIVLAMIIFSLPVTALHTLGIVVTLCGGAYYAKVGLDAKTKSVTEQQQAQYTDDEPQDVPPRESLISAKDSGHSEAAIDLEKQ